MQPARESCALEDVPRHIFLDRLPLRSEKNVGKVGQFLMAIPTAVPVGISVEEEAPGPYFK